MCMCVMCVCAMWGDIYGCSIVARCLTTEREDGDPGWEGEVIHSTGDDQSPLPTPLVAWNEGRWWWGGVEGRSWGRWWRGDSRDGK